METLHLAADTEDAALAVGEAGAVRQKFVVSHGPNGDRLAHAPGDLRGDLLVAEVAVDDQHSIHLFRLETLDDLFCVRVAVHDVHRIDALQVHERHMLIRIMLLNVLDCRAPALLRLFPVEDTRPGRNIPAHGGQTDLDLVIQHIIRHPLHESL